MIRPDSLRPQEKAIEGHILILVLPQIQRTLVGYI